jgi:hypothetical protein
MLSTGTAPRPSALVPALCLGVGWWVVATYAPSARRQAREVRGTFREVRGLLQLWRSENAPQAARTGTRRQ